MSIIDLLKDEIRTSKENALIQQNCSYSQAIQTTKRQKEGVVIVKQKNSDQASEVIKRNIEERINPCKNKV